MRNLISVVSIALLASVAHAKDGDISKGVDLSDLADLEALSQQVERDAFKRLPLKHFVPDLPKGLTFTGYTGFRERWKDAYVTVGRKVVFDLAKLCNVDVSDKSEKLKKRWNRLKKAVKKETNTKKKRKESPETAEGYLVLRAGLPRINQLIELLFGEADPKLEEARTEDMARFKKRFELGKQLSAVNVKSNAEVDVQMVDVPWQRVRGEVMSWRFQPLKKDGAQVTLGGFKVMHASKMRTGRVRVGMRRLSHLEYYRLTFSPVGKISVDGKVSGSGQSKLEIVGARLLLGFYYFVRYGDQLVVIKEPKPLRKPIK